MGAICDGIEDMLPDRRVGATPLLGAAKCLSGGLLISAGLLGQSSLQTAGSTLYVGILYGQYKNAVDGWLKDRFPHLGRQVAPGVSPLRFWGAQARGGTL